MASYDEPIAQAKSNITFLENINKTCDSFWDWQTTVCFYIGVHLINSHLAAKDNLHYRSHEKVSHAVNPYNSKSTCALPEPVYVAFTNLQLLSRRSRYLISDNANDKSETAHFTSEKYFARAVRYLDVLMQFMILSYGCKFPTCNLNCDKLKSDTLANFKVK